MIWIFLFLVLTAAVLYLGVRLFLYQKQLRALTRQLEELNDDSNQRLTCFLQDGAVTSLCRQINQCIDIQQQAVLHARETEKDLKYTIACVSHDIRTPLTGAAGYVQLLEKTADPQKHGEYCTIVRQRLGDLEQLLDELFLYTRLTGDALSLTCAPVQLFPLVCDALTGFYTQFEKQHREPRISFDREALQVNADAQQLRRVLRNLISNALSHGTGPLYITQKGSCLTFSNQVEQLSDLDAAHLFDRFYRADASRQGNHAGLGLSISKELMERVGGSVRAEKREGKLCITLEFQPGS